MKSIKRQSLLLLVAVLCAATGWAQPYRINRQRLCIEGVSFAKKASVSSSNYLFMDDFSIAPGETKTVPVYLTSSMPIWLFQADVVLPSGLTATDVEFSSAFAGTTAASQYSVESGTVNGNFRVLTINTTKTRSIPSGTRQHLLNLTIKAASGLSPQSLTATISGFDFIEASTGYEYAYEGESRSCTVTITQSLATGLTLSRSELSLYVGDQSTLTATVTPSTASQSVAWGSSNTDVVTVNQSGVVTAVGAGSAIVTATTTDGSYITRTCTVTVSRRQATSVTVSPTSATLQVGDTKQLTATVSPSSALQGVTWSTSNSSVATVSSSGLVSAKATGTATITATAQDGSGKKGTCTITVSPVKVSSVTVQPSSVSIEAGKSVTLTATIAPSNASNKAVGWTSSNTNVAIVSADGVVTGKNVGTCTITATAKDGSGKKGTCSVTVTRPTATGMTLSHSELSLYVGDQSTLTATVTPSTASQSVAWGSSNTDVVTVNQSGVVTAVGAGSAIVTATTTDGSYITRTCTVTVSRRQATSVTVSPTSATLQVGDTKQLTATVSPSSALQGVTWSTSNSSVATVSSSGLVSAKATGTATITATAQDGSGKKGTCTITVNPVLATSITLDRTEITLGMGESTTLTATVLPANATNRNVTWKSSNTTIATVTSGGVVTARSEGTGTATITATTADGTNLKATCHVTVTRQTATSLTLNTEILTVEKGRTTQLTATVTPGTASQALEWSSANTDVATVDATGRVTGVADGHTVVTARTLDGSNLTASCTVIVEDNSLRGDVTNDGRVDIDDVNAVLNLIIRMVPGDTYSNTADVSDDGNVDVDDLNIIINIILGKDKGLQYVVNGVQFNMVRVQGGVFTMGGTDEQGSDVVPERELPTHQVVLSSYSIGATEVTQELWKAVMGSNPAYFTGDLQRPVENITWNDCMEFITRLNTLTGQSFRLPTEAEWEYAARGGRLSQGYKYAGSDDANSVAWYRGNCGGTTHPVAQKEANELGLYDMSGNVMEFCSDWYGPYSAEMQVNPTGAATGTNRVRRGGCHSYGPEVTRVSDRGSLIPTTTTTATGLRLAK